MDPVDGDQVYAAERLLNMRTKKGKSEYLVKWKGWSAKHNTWEPVDNILDERLIQEFEDNQPGKSASKRKSIAAKEPAEEKPTPAKRGRRPARKTSTSDNTSPSTSVGTRRSSRSVASVTEQQKVGEQQQDESEASEKPVQETSEDSDIPAQEPGDVESEMESGKKKQADKAEVGAKEADTEVEQDDETKEAEPAVESVVPKKATQLESSTEDYSTSDEPVESAEQIAKPQQGLESAADDSLEVFVKKDEPSMEETGENGNTESSEDKVYEIAIEQEAGHKIQMFTVPTTSQPKEPAKMAENKADGDEEDQERFEIVKEYGSANSAASASTNSAFLETVGSEELPANNGQTTHPFLSD